MRLTAQPTVVAEGLGFTEGPLWTSFGELWVASVSRGLIFRVGLGSAAHMQVAEPGGNPTGLCEGPDGSVWIAQGGRHIRSRSTRKTEPSLQYVANGQVHDAITTGLDTPSDCVVGPDGLIWLTDPRGEALASDGPPGAIRTYDPANGALVTKATGIAYPNGLLFGCDDSILYVAETRTGRVLRYRHDNGELIADGVFTHLAQGHPDGLAVDNDGFVYVAGADSHAVHVFDPDGVATERISLPAGAFPTNLCFGGEGLSTLYVTAAAGGRVWATKREVAGFLPTRVLREAGRQ
jgi:gluconolactonase